MGFLTLWFRTTAVSRLAIWYQQYTHVRVSSNWAINLYHLLFTISGCKTGTNRACNQVLVSYKQCATLTDLICVLHPTLHRLS